MTEPIPLRVIPNRVEELCLLRVDPPRSVQDLADVLQYASAILCVAEEVKRIEPDVSATLHQDAHLLVLHAGLALKSGEWAHPAAGGTPLSRAAAFGRLLGCSLEIEAPWVEEHLVAALREAEQAAEVGA